jgi:tRNA pseudouridine38-40 synthase
MIRLDLTANAFLHHMVRNIVGCLVYVGNGKYPAEWIKQVLDARNRSLAAPTFSPAGLYLRQITYDKKWALPQIDRILSNLHATKY